jgi:hypothetical protein
MLKYWFKILKTEIVYLKIVVKICLSLVFLSLLKWSKQGGTMYFFLNFFMHGLCMPKYFCLENSAYLFFLNIIVCYQWNYMYNYIAVYKVMHVIYGYCINIVQVFVKLFKLYCSWTIWWYTINMCITYASVEHFNYYTGV